MKVWREENRDEKIGRLFNELSIKEQGIVAVGSLLLICLPLIIIALTN